MMLSEVEDVFMMWYLVKPRDNFTFTCVALNRRRRRRGGGGKEWL
jgi:hypothetical protein